MGVWTDETVAPVAVGTGAGEARNVVGAEGEVKVELKRGPWI